MGVSDSGSSRRISRITDCVTRITSVARALRVSLSILVVDRELGEHSFEVIRPLGSG